MNREEVLENAIQLAIGGGWSYLYGQQFTVEGGGDFIRWTLDPQGYDHRETYEETDTFSIIYNHDFAKALWGDKTDFDMDGRETGAEWEYHLQEMVIADDPIEYLAENLPGK